MLATVWDLTDLKENYDQLIYVILEQCLSLSVWNWQWPFYWVASLPVDMSCFSFRPFPIWRRWTLLDLWWKGHQQDVCLWCPNAGASLHQHHFLHSFLHIFILQFQSWRKSQSSETQMPDYICLPQTVHHYGGNLAHRIFTKPNWKPNLLVPI